MRAVWLAVGLVATACGIAGVVLPLVPTTPFLLVAAYAFARSSPRLHDWLVTHPRLGPFITDWREHGAIGRGTKVTAVVVMAGTLAISLVMNVAPWLVATQAAVLLAAGAFVLSRPSPPDDAS